MDAKTSSHQDLDAGIAAVAARRSELAMPDGARQFVAQHGPEVIPELRRRFDVMIEPPSDFADREPSACAWIICWQAALYEILYQYREHALPVLRELATSGRDVAAVVQLCRLAAEGVDRERTLTDLERQLPEWPSSVRLDLAWQLLWRGRNDPALAAVREELQQAPAFAQAVAEVQRNADSDDGLWEPGSAPPLARPESGRGRRRMFAAIAVLCGVMVAAAVAPATGWWSAIVVGVLAMAFSAAILWIVDAVALRRM